jgi:hypothetical protein
MPTLQNSSSREDGLHNGGLLRAVQYVHYTGSFDIKKTKPTRLEGNRSIQT